MKPSETTVIICCAGMGARLGIGTTKAMLNIAGKPLIIRQLELLKDYDDVRVVVGFQAQKVIDVITKYRKDIMFVFNHDYKTTGVADSFFKGLRGARNKVLYMDGDIVFHPKDFAEFISNDKVKLCFSNIISDEPLQATISGDQIMMLCSGDKWCWPGVAKFDSCQLKNHTRNMYDLVSEFLPAGAVYIRCREIDTPDDYERANAWCQSGEYNQWL